VADFFILQDDLFHFQGMLRHPRQLIPSCRGFPIP
jgi:hypothetical protein